LLVALGAGVLVAWGGVRLQGIFVEERDSAEVSLVARQRALAQYARVALERRLSQELARGRTRIDAALADPLFPDDGLVLIEKGEQRLPRLRRYLEGTTTPASRLCEELEQEGGRPVADDGTFRERVELLGEFRKALAVG